MKLANMGGILSFWCPYLCISLNGDDNDHKNVTVCNKFKNIKIKIAISNG